jgi:hypothetical protein
MFGIGLVCFLALFVSSFHVSCGVRAFNEVADELSSRRRANRAAGVAFNRSEGSRRYLVADASMADKLLIAVCLVGAPRGLLNEEYAPGQPRLIRDQILKGLAPEGSRAHVKLFGLIHVVDSGRTGGKSVQYDKSDVVRAMDGLVAAKNSGKHASGSGYGNGIKGGSPSYSSARTEPGDSALSMSVGRIVLSADSSCRSPRALAAVPCCLQRPLKNNARGMLITFWADECLGLVVAWEGARGRRFDWVVRARPDLACAAPLPSLATLPPTRVYSTAKVKIRPSP